MTKPNRKNLERTLINLNKIHGIDYSPEQIAAKSVVNLVYRIQFMLIRYECEPFTQGEIDSLIYH